MIAPAGPRKSAFAALTQSTATKAPAPRVVSVPPNAWASEWAGRPHAPVEIGVRFVSDADVQLARSDAAKQAWARHPTEADEQNRTDAFNDALMRWIVARGTCKTASAVEPWFSRDVDSVSREMSSEGVTFLYEAIEHLAIEESPLAAEASDDEIEQLALVILNPDAWALMDPKVARRARRMLAHVLETVQPTR